jgi:putative FmdB family regulatory protein
MPTYTYRCNACNEVTEVNQSIHDIPLSHCIKCNGATNRIITSDFSIQFKGSGFYCTDSK